MRYLFNDEFNDDIHCISEEDYKFFHHNKFDDESLHRLIKRAPHEHTERLASIIEKDMLEIVGDLTESQRNNIKKLKNGHKVVIGGQQAGLFGSPAYILHKVISILVVVKDIKEKVNYDAVPVFWVASEDHDYDEINHTHVYDSLHKRIKKVSYKPNLDIQMSIGFYEYDKKEMLNVLDEVFNYTEDSKQNIEIKNTIEREINAHTYWSELFTALTNKVFSEHGLLIFNAHSKDVRQLEKEIFQRIIEKSEEIDAAFRSGQQSFNQHFDISPTIQTDTNVHLFIHSESNRELLHRDGDVFKTEDKTYTKEELLNYLNESPEIFSNNVVTRPLMQELLFNTIVFLGGGAEVKYWGELHEVFKVMDREMPIVLKRMSFLHVPPQLEKRLNEYDLSLTPNLVEHIEKEKDKLIDKSTNEKLLQRIQTLKDVIEQQYESLGEVTETKHEETLIDINESRMLKEVDYLQRKYQYDVKRQVRNKLNQLDELLMLLLPKNALQERTFHPTVFSNAFIDFTPLTYTDQLIIIID
ncbi:bacillithiol biosynthesis cysteine-adding enzyme BshC [Nosocomiicoccus sp. HMSC059G07]|uniref:bacillithiol biosynthesis cysteine-adding enzyme BshC n=1 Tax=Nosocomiicoccus sp. HMSC059G07 TaxID=1739531 RepID=UPI0008A1C995|nr:bacillithiol biosynthesis cysteine-adding enzyme BshC [Nosocomiicoccus sp. HMSC059G07]OFO51133.1 hypothetical protein HMPREF3029_07580 [Nosocomiicoccus sp. HMSC059G07]